MFDTQKQFGIFLCFVVVGLFVGALFTLSRIPVKVLKWKKLAALPKILADLLFGGVSTTFIFFANLYVNSGKFSPYVFLAITLGCLIYAKLYWLLARAVGGLLQKVLSKRKTKQNETKPSQ